jgi:hypothetical protein
VVIIDAALDAVARQAVVARTFAAAGLVEAGIATRVVVGARVEIGARVGATGVVVAARNERHRGAERKS